MSLITRVFQPVSRVPGHSLFLLAELLVTRLDEYQLHDFSHSVYHVDPEVSLLIKFSIQYTTIQLTKVSSFFQWELTGVSSPLLMYSFITAWYQWHLVYQRLLTSRNSLLGHAVAISYTVVRARVRQFSQPPMIHIQTNIHSFPTCFVVLYDCTNKNLI